MFKVLHLWGHMYKLVTAGAQAEPKEQIGL